MIEVGKKAPAFTLVDQDGEKRSLKDYKGTALVVFFYPKDMTSGCTQQACDFRDKAKLIRKHGAELVGISILGEKSKKKFADKENLNYPLLADDRVNEHGKSDPVVAAKYGVWVEKSMYGRTYMGIQRTTYLLDGNGKVVRRWDKVKVPGHVDEVVEAIKEMS